MADRRTFLAGLVAAGAAATAGCSEGRLGADTDGGEPARYSDFVASEGVEESVAVLSFDWAALGSLQDTETEETPTPTPGEGGTAGDDALAAYPIGVLFGGLFAIGFTAGVAGLGRLGEFDGPSDRIHFVGRSGLVFEGTYEPETVTEGLTEAGLSESGSYEGYELYEGDVTAGQTTVAVSESIVTLVTAGDGVTDPTATTERLLDSEAEQIERLRAADEAFDRLTRRLSSGAIESVQYAVEGDVRDAGTETESDGGTSPAEIGLEGEIRGLASSASLTETEFTSRMAFLFASEDEVPERADLEVELGAAASDREITIDGRLVSVSGTYRDDAVGGDAPLS